MLIRDFVARRSVECITDFEQGEFFERYVPTMRGSEMEWIRQTSRMRRPWAMEDTLTRAGIICWSLGWLLCPNFDKAWTTTEVAEHTGDSDWWVAVQGRVYDMSNFIHGDHSGISGAASDAANDLEKLAGLDMTNYFPLPLVLACRDIVTESSLEPTHKNFTAVVPLAMHKSGSSQSVQNTASQCGLVHRDIPAEDEELSQGASGMGHSKYCCAGCEPGYSTVCSLVLR
jgi:predicted heme/steroid binding protein